MTTEAGARETWTTEEAATRLGMPVRTVQDLCKSGELPAVLLANRYYLPVWGLRDFIARRSGCPLPEENGNGVESRPDTARLKELRRLLAEAERVAAELE